MKKHSKVFKVIIFFVIFIMVVSSSNLSAYADTELSITCPKNLCSKKIKLCGPLLYGATIPSSIPYLGGTTLSADNTRDLTISNMTTNDHFFVAYCPNYTNLGLSKHAMALFRFNHNYATQSYEQLSSDVTSGESTYQKNDYHLTTYKCTGSDIIGTDGIIISQALADGTLNSGYLSDEELDTIQTIIGSTGCNGVKQKYEHHNWSQGTWTSYDGTYHQRTNTCSDCGYTITEKTIHNTSSSTWTSDSSTQHKKTVSCSVCGYSRIDKENHTFTCSNYTSVDETKHSVKRICSVCGYTDTIEQDHSFTFSGWREFSQNEQNRLDSNAPDTMNNHVRTKTCSNCGYVGYEYQSHDHIRDFEGYEPSISDDHSAATWHYYSVHCHICNHGVIIYSRHVYNSSENVYTDISSVKHRVTQNCLDCSYVNEVEENHTFTTTCEPISDTKHKFTATCICDHTNISYGDHHDGDNNCYCDDCGYLMTKFSVTIPATLSLVMDNGGNVYTPTNAIITNNSTAAVKVTGISLFPKNGWTIVPYSTNMANEKVDSNKIGLKLRDSKSTSGNSMPLTGNWNISKGSNLPLIYSAVVSATSQPITGQNVLDVTFVIDWRD